MQQTIVKGTTRGLVCPLGAQSSSLQISTSAEEDSNSPLPPHPYKHTAQRNEVSLALCQGILAVLPAPLHEKGDLSPAPSRALLAARGCYTDCLAARGSLQEASPAPQRPEALLVPTVQGSPTSFLAPPRITAIWITVSWKGWPHPPTCSRMPFVPLPFATSASWHLCLSGPVT